jgi:hypothetical protein
MDIVPHIRPSDRVIRHRLAEEISVSGRWNFVGIRANTAGITVSNSEVCTGTHQGIGIRELESGIVSFHQREWKMLLNNLYPSLRKAGVVTNTNAKPIANAPVITDAKREKIAEPPKALLVVGATVSK